MKSNMIIWYIISFFYCNILPLGNATNINLPSTKNIAGRIGEKKFVNITINGLTDGIVLYSVPKTELDDPMLFGSCTTALFSDQQTFISSIKVIVNSNNNFFVFKNRPWYKVKIVFSNNEEQEYLLPKETKIECVDYQTKIFHTFYLQALIHDMLIIDGLASVLYPQHGRNTRNVKK